MNSALAMAIALVVAFFGYYVYVRYIDRRVIVSDPNKVTPAKMYMDGVDFMPTSRHVLFGYQFKSIAALGPVVGPIVAMQWGWLAGLLWVVLGTLLFGWAHDYAAAMTSIRNEGQSYGALSYRLISPRARSVLLAFIYFYLILICAAFADMITRAMMSTTSIPLAILGLMVLGICTGLLIYRARWDLILTTVIMVVLSFVCIWAGTVLPIKLNFHILLLYTLFFSYLGAVLPIWAYAQPVNYIAFYLVFLGIVGAVIGIFIGHPQFSAPVFTTWKIGAGPLWPILFVTIACGAISGWHGLLSASGTSRQLERETDTRYVVAGSMFTEMVLATVALIIAASFATFGAYKEALKAGPASVFVGGMANLLAFLKIPSGFGAAFAGAMFVVLAITVLQLAVRFARVATADLAPEKAGFLRNPHVGTLIALLITWVLVVTGTFSYIWTLFGGANQLMAALGLLLASIWLAGQKKNFWWTYGPMWFMLVTTIAALGYTSYTLIIKVMKLYAGTIKPAAGRTLGVEVGGNIIAAAIGIFLIVAAIVLAVDGVGAFYRKRAEAKKAPAAAD
ncbi:MAG: carbon starvation protein A [Acetobacteraceae bacterium]|nr:carbon starvation protein A [Acetobacteraceae bacterium]